MRPCRSGSGERPRGMRRSLEKKLRSPSLGHASLLPVLPPALPPALPRACVHVYMCMCVCARACVLCFFSIQIIIQSHFVLVLVCSFFFSRHPHPSTTPVSPP